MLKADALQHTDSWETLPWRKLQQKVFRLQKRIYQASTASDYNEVHTLQRLLLKSRAAKLLAVRKVTQDNRGKRTAGVDGKANLSPEERLALADTLSIKAEPQNIRRVNIKKADGDSRGLGIPTIHDRAVQALVKLALEPEWEAKFEPNSYGFRPGRSAHDAIQAIFSEIRAKSKYVLHCDIEKCFDRIEHDQLLAKLNTIGPLEKLIRKWLKAGIVDHGHTLFPEAGVPQGGVLSPLLSNVALHGLEYAITKGPERKQVGEPKVVRYADDVVIFSPDLDKLQTLRTEAEAFLATMGLRLKPSKTSISHTLNHYDGKAGFDFLGFDIRQYPVGKHHSAKVRTSRGSVALGFKTIIKPSKDAVKRHLFELERMIRHYRNFPRRELILKLMPIVRGWTAYYAKVCSKETFNDVDSQIFHKLMRYVKWRHKGSLRRATRINFDHKWRLKDGNLCLPKHTETPIQRHVKVRGNKSPFDGDWVYWARRLGLELKLPKRVALLIKKQRGKCGHCNLRISLDDVLEVHHRDGNKRNDVFANFLLVHGHCHDQIHRGAYDKS